jgi:large conductance mechanosensitive channel
MLKEFKEFAMKGSLLDMAIGVVIGAAFGAVTTAFIDGLFMPLIGLLFQVGDLNAAKIVLSAAQVDAAGKVITPESALMYGKFIGSVINFIIIAFVMFLIIKGMNAAKRQKPEAPSAPVAPPAQEVLLGEIRDLLKQR